MMRRILKQPYLLLIIVLMFIATNFALINRAVSVQDSEGRNFLGVRDVLVAIILLIGLFRGIDRDALRNRIVQLCIALLSLAVMGIVVGIAHDASLRAVATDFVTLCAWLLPVALAKYLTDSWRIKIMLGVVVLLGALESLGVFVETATQGELAIVTPAMAERVLDRSTPMGWPTMMLAASCLITFLLDTERRRWQLQWLALAILFLIVVASLLTQSRTLLVGIGVSVLLYWAMAVMFCRWRIRWIRIPVFVFLLFAAVPVTMVLGSLWSRADFGDLFAKRYAVLYSRSEAEEHLQVSEGRVDDLEYMVQLTFADSPLFGVGLGTQYIPGSPGAMPHNIVGYFLLRFGLIGVAFFSVFAITIVVSLARAIQDNGPFGGVGRAVGLGMLNLLICAFFGNVFAVAYASEQAMIGLALLVAYQRAREQGYSGAETVPLVRRRRAQAALRSY